MAHNTTVEAEQLLDKEFKVLDKGFVRLVDYMGSDSRIVQAARVSYGEGTKAVREDKALIDYLMRHRHTSPFEMITFLFHIKLPIFVARQWVRHRTASLNEISGRYSVMQDEFYLPDNTEVRYQSNSNKQGRGDETLPEESAREVVDTLQQEQASTYQNYEKLLESGLARELARINLPLSLYTEMYWQMNLHNLFHFLKLRLDDHAQYEIRAYAQTIANIVKVATPMAYEAFEEHILNGRSFSAKEIDIIKQALDTSDLQSLAKESGLRKTRSNEFLKKLGLGAVESKK